MYTTKYLLKPAFVLAVLSAFLPAVFAYDVTYKTTTAVPFNGGCERFRYTPETEFLTTDTAVNVYFELSAVVSSDQVSVQWIQPDKKVNRAGAWASATGERCYATALPIAGASPASLPGAWHVQLIVNGSTAFDLPFNISGIAAPPVVKGPSYTGSFDTIPPDCSRMGGWAQDQNSTDTIVSVDISVSGFPTITRRAGDFRSDVGNHAWSVVDLQLYKDGQSHAVHAYYSGTTQDLPNSPQPFPPVGFQQSCLGTPAAVSVNWTAAGQPPAAAIGGQVIQIAWSVVGPATQSRVIYSANGSPNASNPQYSTAWQAGGNLTQNASITLPVVTSATVFTIMIQAQANGKDYLSSALQMSVAPPASSQTWTYDTSTVTNPNSPDAHPLSGFTVLLEKKPMSLSVYEYRLSVIGQDGDGAALSSVLFTLIRPVRVTASATSFTKEVNYKTAAEILGDVSLGWQSASDDAVSADANAFLDSLTTLTPIYGTLKSPANAAAGAGPILSDLLDLTQSTSKVPDPDLLAKLSNINDYHHDSVVIGAKAALLGLPQPHGLRLRFQVNEQQQPLEDFLVRMKNAAGAVVALQIGSDPNRKAAADRLVR